MVGLISLRRLFRNDEEALRLEQGEHLMYWRDNPEKGLLIDKYDVRQLLDTYSSFVKPFATVLDQDPEYFLNWVSF
jgi:hypothetical protein